MFYKRAYDNLRREYERERRVWESERRDLIERIMLLSGHPPPPPMILPETKREEPIMFDYGPEMELGPNPY
jgi:hypothetical protein